MLDEYKVKTGDPHNLIEDKVAEEAAYAVGNPSYKDLAEENAYLRSERSQLYDELARVSSNDVQVRGDSTRDEVIESLERELIKEKDQNIRLGGQFDFLKSEIAHLQFHGSEQAAVAKSLEERLEGSQECLHAANAELLQILPLRIKLNDLRQKTENISADVLAANNDKHQLIQERDRLKSSLDAVTHSMETAQGKLMSSSRKAQDLKIEKSDLLTQIKALDEKIKELTAKNESLERLIKEQEERIIEITTDSAHWERKSLSLSRELGKFSGSQMQQVSQYAELKEAYAVLKSKLQLREEAINSMIEQSRHTAEEQRAHAARKSKVGLGNCVTGHPVQNPQHAHTRWSLESTGISVRSCTSKAGASSPNGNSRPHSHTHSSGKSSSNGNSVSNSNSNGNRGNSRNSDLVAEEAKLINGTSSHRHGHGHGQSHQPRYAGAGEEDCEESEHSNSESCASMCETFSFLSVDKKRNSYGKI